MINHGFDESNLIRSYPFVTNLQKIIPDWLVVDFRAMIVDGTYDPAVHNVWLSWVGRLDTKLRLGFRCDAPTLQDEELVFEVDISSGEFVTVFAESTPNLTTIEERCGCDEQLFCDTDFAGDTQCGPELICDPRFEKGCGTNLICDVNDPPL